MKKAIILLLVLSTALVACKTTKEPATDQTKVVKKDIPYEILYKSNIPEEIQFQNQSKKGSNIDVVYNAVGTQTRIVENLRLIDMNKGPSSPEITKGQIIEFPFWGKLSYDSNKGEGEMEFRIYEKGYWVLTLTTLSME